VSTVQAVARRAAPIARSASGLVAVLPVLAAKAASRQKTADAAPQVATMILIGNRIIVRPATDYSCASGIYGMRYATATVTVISFVPG
jgi:hypothetical protein